jgi:soluble lytic murein transglycosylase
MKYSVIVIALLAACGTSDHQASAAGEVSAAPPSADLARALAQSDELQSAQAALDQGHPWRATQLVAPLLKAPLKRTPAALLVGARAAAGWGGWAEVDKLLAKESWLDVQFDGEARELLTRSSLEQGGDTAALRQATLAIKSAKGADMRAERLVYLARALERNNLFDSAAVVYTQAGETLRPIHDWLALRVAGSQSDSAKRARTFAGIALAVARARIPWTEAQARERFGDALGAAPRYAALGATVQSLRLRLGVAPDTATRDVVKSELLAYIRTHSGTGESKNAVDVIDKGFRSLTPQEELIIARSTAASGPQPRSVVAFERAMTAPSLMTPNDHLQYALVLSRAGRSADANSQFAAVQGPLAAQAAYQRARTLLTSGTGDATRAALRDVVTRFPNDSASASASLFLLADLSSDAGSDDQARTFYRQLYHNYPNSARAADARFNSAIISLAGGNARSAAVELDSLYTLMPKSDEANAARYWSGRAWAAAGNDAFARARWKDAIAQQAASYYATTSARRLGEKAWAPPARADSFTHIAAVDNAVARAALLERLGMDTEARFEYEAMEAGAPPDVERIAATAQALLEHGQPSRTIRLAQKLIDLGQRDARTYRLLFPVLDRDELSRNAKARGLDPALVAGLIRQESNFNARAVSAANARGLMQVLPAVGEEIARGLNYPVWYPALLLDPDANLQLGTAHLATYTKQYGPLPRVLAAYNAGGSRVTRWATKTGMDDPEMFAERVPFTETRDYVRIVQRNADMYRALYAW